MRAINTIENVIFVIRASYTVGNVIVVISATDTFENVIVVICATDTFENVIAVIAVIGLGVLCYVRFGRCGAGCAAQEALTESVRGKCSTWNTQLG